MTTCHAVYGGKHLTTFHDHLDNMLVAHVFGSKNRICIENEDVHGSIIHPDLCMSSRLIRIQLHPLLQDRHTVQRSAKNPIHQ